jgi:hypothetical protein
MILRLGCSTRLDSASIRLLSAIINSSFLVRPLNNRCCDVEQSKKFGERDEIGSTRTHMAGRDERLWMNRALTSCLENKALSCQSGIFDQMTAKGLVYLLISRSSHRLLKRSILMQIFRNGSMEGAFYWIIKVIYAMVMQSMC